MTIEQIKEKLFCLEHMVESLQVKSKEDGQNIIIQKIYDIVSSLDELMS